MIEQILTRKNLLQAMYKVQKNHGSAGVDYMPVTSTGGIRKELGKAKAKAQNYHTENHANEF